MRSHDGGDDSDSDKDHACLHLDQRSDLRGASVNMNTMTPHTHARATHKIEYDWKNFAFYLVLAGGIIVAVGVVITSIGKTPTRRISCSRTRKYAHVP